MHGLTPVHVAVTCENAYVLRALLSPDSSGITEDMKGGMDKDGMAPLEALESWMRSTRQYTELLVGVGKGYSDDT